MYLFQHIAAIFKKIFTENYTSTTYYYFVGIYYIQSLDEALKKVNAYDIFATFYLEVNLDLS